MEALYSFRDGIVLKTTDLGGASQLSVNDSYDFASNNSQIKVFEELFSVSLKIVNNRLAAEINLRNEKIEVFSITKIHDYFCDGKYWVPLNKGNLSDIKELLNEIGLPDLGNLTFSQKLFLSVQGKRLTPPIDDSNMEQLEEISEQRIPILAFGEPYDYQKIGFKWLRWL
jgi:hypothetical protein